LLKEVSHTFLVWEHNFFSSFSVLQLAWVESFDPFQHSLLSFFGCHIYLQTNNDQKLLVKISNHQCSYLYPLHQDNPPMSTLETLSNNIRELGMVKYLKIIFYIDTSKLSNSFKRNEQRRSLKTCASVLKEKAPYMDS